MRNDLQQGIFKFNSRLSYKINNKFISFWSAKDWIVLKNLSKDFNQFLNTCLPVYSRKNKGGLKEAVKYANNQQQNYKYFFKSDIKSFYASINPEVVYSLLSENKIKDERIHSLLYKYCNANEIYNAEYRDIKGIPKGCPLSPIISDLILQKLDEAIVENKNISYLRYVDDFIIFTNNKAQLRKMIKLVHRVLVELKLELSIPKTQIGKTTKSIAFLGYVLRKREKCTLSKKTVENHLIKMQGTVTEWVIS